MGKVTVLLSLILLWHPKLMAATITASSPSLHDVQAAINSATNDDTIIVPAGTARWTSTLLIDKSVTLIGQTSTDPVAGTAVDKTIIQDDVARVPGGAPIIKIISLLGETYRVSGLTFQGLAPTRNNNGAIKTDRKFSCRPTGSLSFPANAGSGSLCRNHGPYLWRSGS